jgi:hypothetical protein
MQQAAAWTPWVWWCLIRYANTPRTGGERLAGPRRLVMASVVLGLQCLAGHFQIAALSVVGALVWLLSRVRWRSTNSRGAQKGRRRSRPAAWGLDWRRALGGWLLTCVCAVGLFAIQWLPTFDYLRLCTRVQHTYRDFVENSWNPVSTVGWVLPMLFGQRTPNFFDQPYWGPSHQVEQFGYAGVLPLFLAVAALRSGWRSDPRRRPWILLGAFGLLLSLGQYGLICPLLYWIPGSSLFRCPARALLLVNLALAALAAVTLHDLGVALGKKRAALRRTVARWTSRPLASALVLVALPLLVVLAAAPWMSAELRTAALRAIRPWNTAVWAPFLTALVSFSALAGVVRLGHGARAVWLLTIVSTLDLAVIGWTIDVPTAAGDPRQLITPEPPVDWMEAVAESSHRLWVVTGRHHETPGEYVRPVEKAVANTDVLRQIASLTDYGPLHPRTIVERFGFEPWGETRAPERLLADTRWMRLYNVGWVLLCDEYWPAPVEGELATTTAQGWRLYEVPGAAGDAFFADAAQSGAAQCLRNSPSALTILADTWPTSAPTGRGSGSAGAASVGPRVVIAQLFLPGWTARVNGRPAPIEPVDNCLMSVRVPAGEAAKINLVYFPPGLKVGAGISALCVVASAVALVRGPRPALTRRSAGSAGRRGRRAGGRPA